MSNTSFLALSALGTDHPGIVEQLSKAIEDCGCSITDSRMTVLGGEFAIILLLNGNWDAIAKIESATKRLESELNLTISSKRTQQRAPSSELLPYSADVIAIDHPGIVHEVAEFFSSRSINIEDLYTGSYSATHTGTPMFSLHITISVPASLSVAALRGEFLDFCDSLNLDAVLEPAK